MKSRVLLAAAALAVPVLVQSPAHADVAIAVGTGSISPGIPVTGCVDNAEFSISGTAANLGTTFGPGPYTFVADGDSSICESIQAGSGSATLSGDVSGTLSYIRTVGVITLTGDASVQGSAPRPISISCEVVITSANPVTTFAVVCAVQI